MKNFVSSALPESNRGFQMLSKMGWKKGEALGSDAHSSTAIKEPIQVKLFEHRDAFITFDGISHFLHFPLETRFRHSINNGVRYNS